MSLARLFLALAISACAMASSALAEGLKGDKDAPSRLPRK